MATMTGTQVVTEVRKKISDSVTTYRWLDAVLLQYINDGQREILRRHPEAGHNTTVNVDAFEPITKLTEDLRVVDTFKLPLVYLVASFVLEEDSEDAANRESAAYYLTRFEQTML